MKKILTLIGACAIVFAMGGIAKVNAGTTDNVTGWIWGGSQDAAGIYSGLGWISMNSTNCDIDGDGIYEGNAETGGPAPAGCPTSGAVSNYGVNIPTTGNVTGYAWSENVGAIDFAPHSGCAGKYAGACLAYPVGVGFPTTDVIRTGVNLDGWARIIDVAKANAAGTSGTCGGSSCEGWIRMSGPTYGVTIDGAGKLGSPGKYAWSDQFGYINFASDSAMIPPPPTVTLTANPITINVENPLPQNTYLTWSTTNATSCVASTAPDVALWSGAKATASVGPGDAVQIDATHLTENFTLTCTGPGGLDTKTVGVTTGCNIKTCGGETCGSVFTSTGSATNAPCIAASTCSTDNDCADRSTGTWQEVTP